MRCFISAGSALFALVAATTLLDFTSAYYCEHCGCGTGYDSLSYCGYYPTFCDPDATNPIDPVFFTNEKSCCQCDNPLTPLNECTYRGSDLLSMYAGGDFYYPYFCATYDPNAPWVPPTSPGEIPNINILPTWDMSGLYPCDAQPPTIDITAGATNAFTPGLWFTSIDQLSEYVNRGSVCKDDCWSVEDGTLECTIDTFPSSTSCAHTQVLVNAVDKCQNTNTKVYQVRYDDQEPTVTVRILNPGVMKLVDKTAKNKMVDLNLEVDVSDNCDLYPEVSITVYSDEKALGKTAPYDAILNRLYSNDTSSGVLTGWGLSLTTFRTSQKNCDTDFACDDADGRFFVVRVCAKDQAGWENCAEDSVGVLPKGVSARNQMLAKHNSPVTSADYDGKLYILAEDVAYWNSEPTELDTCRPESIGDLETLVDPNIDDTYCGTYAITSPALATSQTDTTRECSDACAVEQACWVYTWNTITGACALYPESYLLDKDSNTAVELFVWSGDSDPSGPAMCPGVNLCNNWLGDIPMGDAEDGCNDRIDLYSCGDYLPCYPIGNAQVGDFTLGECESECIFSYGIYHDGANSDCYCLNTPIESVYPADIGASGTFLVYGTAQNPSVADNQADCVNAPSYVPDLCAFPINPEAFVGANDFCPSPTP